MQRRILVVLKHVAYAMISVRPVNTTVTNQLTATRHRKAFFVPVKKVTKGMASLPVQTWTNAKPTNTTVWETNDVKISTEDTSVGMWLIRKIHLPVYRALKDTCQKTENVKTLMSAVTPN